MLLSVSSWSSHLCACVLVNTYTKLDELTTDACLLISWNSKAFPLPGIFVDQNEKAPGSCLMASAVVWLSVPKSPDLRPWYGWEVMKILGAGPDGGSSGH